MIITHEPTYYNHLVEIDFFRDDLVYLSKKKFIEDHNLVIFRFHDQCHSTRPDGIHTGMISELGWADSQINPDEMVFSLTKQSVGCVSKNTERSF